MAAQNSKTENPFEANFAKFFDAFSGPRVDLDAFAAFQQSGMAALSEVNKLAAAGFQTIAKRQAEMVRAAFEDSSEAAKKLAAAKPEARLDTSAKLARTAFETAAANFQELGDLAIKSQAQAFDQLGSVYAQTVDEWKAAS
ncbi:MAG: phasin family protein [Alphaproteobacteria bacterium]|nr:phasin family protein [Alphaproteobacteria bacterium]